MNLFSDICMSQSDSQPETRLDEWYRNNGFGMIAGVDEAGRGALAGPVCAAAVILGDQKIEGLNDSKKLTPETRSELYSEIYKKALAVGVSMVGPARIDVINILNATLEAMTLAVGMLEKNPDVVLIDGNKVPAGIDNAVAVIKGDTKSESIMAASIVAKVTRDWWMDRVSAEFPDYGFRKHKGYAVEEHYAALEENGLTSIHRLTFSPCRDMLEGLQAHAQAGTIGARVFREKSR